MSDWTPKGFERAYATMEPKVAVATGLSGEELEQAVISALSDHEVDQTGLIVLRDGKCRELARVAPSTLE